ncbi:hypothetical protein GGR54DRAFT_638335 [Hypoxylon sp. NC1633]|nr:hypothetical protein GGR54DRAFT_638335 [Hypoxylon sp. NC1633]
MSTPQAKYEAYEAKKLHGERLTRRLQQAFSTGPDKSDKAAAAVHAEVERSVGEKRWMHDKYNRLIDELNSSGIGVHLHSGVENPPGWSKVEGTMTQIMDVQQDLISFYEGCLYKLGVTVD